MLDTKALHQEQQFSSILTPQIGPMLFVIAARIVLCPCHWLQTVNRTTYDNTGGYDQHPTTMYYI